MLEYFPRGKPQKYFFFKSIFRIKKIFFSYIMAGPLPPPRPDLRARPFKKNFFCCFPSEPCFIFPSSLCPFHCVSLLYSRCPRRSRSLGRTTSQGTLSQGRRFPSCHEDPSSDNTHIHSNGHHWQDQKKILNSRPYS